MHESEIRRRDATAKRSLTECMRERKRQNQEKGKGRKKVKRDEETAGKERRKKFRIYCMYVYVYENIVYNFSMFFYKYISLINTICRFKKFLNC